MSTALRLYSRDCCAICGRDDAADVEDHDHETGLTRGFLCRSCNTREGMNRYSGGIWEMYRQRNPFSILGIRQKYIGGWGWTADRPGNAELYPHAADRWRNNAMAGAFS